MRLVEHFISFPQRNNDFNKFNNTGAQMLDSIYHMTLKSFSNHILDMTTVGFCQMRDVKSVIL